ncbi:hypothetical protein ACM01_20200 [Streptomyces viridochromogenes]|uniref:Transposase n=1 Tax=Streptomyces viridochromogenes TaxID=1938 RepID=A0A0J7ZCG2_STRVR|nr:hypothetical protein ACM01_20200 [Streptomyces viridochromogenes]KOG07751.1 hypothetical protein ADK36_44455 [Streptomyces viridochromogenes]KOG24039.1 hypothetical protein ADK35_11660 [Streptomyces viridochromogenes]
MDTAWRWRLDLSGLRGALDVVRDDVCGRKFADWAAWRAWGRRTLLLWQAITTYSRRQRRHGTTPPA